MSESFASNNFPTKLFHNEQRWHERERERANGEGAGERACHCARTSVRPPVRRVHFHREDRLQWAWRLEIEQAERTRPQEVLHGMGLSE